MFTELVQSVLLLRTPPSSPLFTHKNKLLFPPAAFCRLKASSWQMFLSAARAPVAEWRCWERRTTASTLKAPAEKHCVWQKWSAIGGFARYLQGSRYEHWFSIGQAIRTHANSRDWNCLFFFFIRLQWVPVWSKSRSPSPLALECYECSFFYSVIDNSSRRRAAKRNLFFLLILFAI